MNLRAISKRAILETIGAILFATMFASCGVAVFRLAS